MKTPKRTSSNPTPPAGNNISPSRQCLTQKLCAAFLSNGIAAKVCEQHVEIETEKAGPVLLLMSEDSIELSVWTSIPLPTPQSSVERLEVLNAINAESMGARFYQGEGEDDNVIDVTENRLIGGEGLEASTAIQFVDRFALDVARAEKLLLTAGFFDEPPGSTGTACGESAIRVPRKDLQPIHSLPRPL